MAIKKITHQREQHNYGNQKKKNAVHAPHSPTTLSPQRHFIITNTLVFEGRGG
eukprot:m.73946 g.73946  ORF g.73946 m.73946 type:complete len:53 (+) comp24607_c0_seq1:144-302(+)